MSFGETSDETASEHESTKKKDTVAKIKHKSSTTDTKSQPQAHKEQSSNKEVDGKSVFKCEESGCGETFDRLWRLTAHRQQTHQSNKRLNEIFVQEPEIKKAKKQSKEHKCLEPGCGAVFSRPYRLRNHILRHQGQKPFLCPFEDCNKSYTNNAHLKRHKILTHLSDEDHSKEVICGVEGCGLVLSNKFNLKKHIAQVHTDFPFRCKICGEKFLRRSQLYLHKTEIHKEEARFKCTKCSLTFIEPHLYNKHVSRHRTYKCDCEKTFGKWTEYLKHKRTDCTIPKLKYQCVICEKIFVFKQSLTQHCIKVHLTESQAELFKCPYLDCNRSYKYKRNLDFHIRRTHEKLIEIFNCTHKGCQTKLNSKKNLKQHLRNMHSGKPLKEKKRKPRKDKGIPKKSVASELTGVKVTMAEHKKNIAGANKSVNESTILDADGDEQQNTSGLVSYIRNILYKNKEGLNENRPVEVSEDIVIHDDDDGVDINDIRIEFDFPELILNEKYNSSNSCEANEVACNSGTEDSGRTLPNNTELKEKFDVTVTNENSDVTVTNENSDVTVTNENSDVNNKE